MTRRAGLDRELVISAAAALADADGLEKLTLAGLAGRLGVRVPSLYSHVAGLDGLRRDLALLGTRELERCLGRAGLGRAGAEAILALANAHRAFAKARPGLYAATVRSAQTAAAVDAELRGIQDEVLATVVAVLESLGLRGEEAIHAARGFRAIAHGFATLEASGGFGLPLECDESFRRLVVSYLAGLKSEATACNGGTPG